MADSTKEEYILWMLDEMAKGDIQRSSVLGKFDKKWGKSSSTFDRNWKVALERHRDRLLEAQSIKDELILENEKKATENGILTRNQKQKILSDIAKGNVIRKFGEGKDAVSMLVTDAERIRAINELNKMQGDYEPELFKIKTENVTLDPKKMSTEALLEMLAAKKKMEDD